MFFDALYESIKNGGWVLWPIFLTGVWAIYLLLNSALYIGWDFYRKDFDDLERLFIKSLDSGSNLFLKTRASSGLIPRVLHFVFQNKDLKAADRVSVLQIHLKSIERQMEYGMYFVGVLAAAAPLLGLLGTVQGMVTTFDTITLYGNSNPVLLADGISEALLTTQSGLVIAFPVMLLKHRIEDRIFYIKKQMQRLCLYSLHELEKRD